MSDERDLDAALSSSPAAYLAQVTRLLWPGSQPAGSGNQPASVEASWVVVPRSDRPKLLVPAGSRRAAATVARRYAEPKTRRARLRGTALALAFRSGLGQRIFPGRLNIAVPDGTASLSDHVSEELGVSCLFGLHVGPARANRKPVLTLVSADGRLIGFAKLGVNDLTKQLVRTETAALRQLADADLDRLVVAEVLHAGGWQGMELLVQSPLPVWQRRGADAAAVREAALLELAAIGQSTARLVDSPFWLATTKVLADIPSTAAGALRDAARRIAPAAEAVVRLGAWHGDWHPSNMAVVDRRLLVWDWERFAFGVPVGCDALHYELQQAITVAKTAPRKAADDLIRNAPRHLSPLGVASADVALITAAYLLHLGARYLHDDQAAAGGRLGQVEQWLVPSVIELAASLAPVHAIPSRGQS